MSNSNTFIDVATGEILTKRQINKKHKEHTIDMYVGIETKFPSDCTTKDQLLESLSVLDSYLDKSVKVNYAALLKSVNESILTVKESSVLSYLAEHITDWNYFIGRYSDIEHLIENRDNRTKMLKSLESKGLIEITHKGFFYKDSVVIKINPFYAWKGDVSLRDGDGQVDKWYAPKSNLLKENACIVGAEDLQSVHTNNTELQT